MSNNSNNNKAPFPPKQTFLSSDMMEEISKQESSKAKSEPLLSKLDKQYDVSYNHYEESVKLNNEFSELKQIVKVHEEKLYEVEERQNKREWKLAVFSTFVGVIAGELIKLFKYVFTNFSEIVDAVVNFFN